MLAEVAPFAVPQFDALLVSLLVIAGAFVCLGLVTVLHSVVRATVGGIGGLLAKLPLVGGVLSSPVNAVYHWMNHVFSSAELFLDKTLAHYLHSLATLIHWFGREIADLSKLVHVLATVALGTSAIDALNRLTEAIVHRLASVEHTADVAIRRIGQTERVVTARLERWIDPRIHALEHAIDGVVLPDIAGLRARTRELVDRLENVWQQVRKVDALLGTAAVTAAVAIALTRLELNWIRCRNWRNIGRGICGIPSALIDALLVGAIETFAVADLCGFAAIMGAEAAAILPVLYELVDAEEALIGCHGATAPPDLALPPLQLPPVATPLALSA